MVQAPDRRFQVYWSPPNVVPWSAKDLKFQAMYASMGANVVYPYTQSYAIWACPSTVLAQQFPGDPVYKQFTPGVKPTEISYQFNGLLGSLTTAEVHHTSLVPLVWEGPENRRFLGSNVNNPGLDLWVFTNAPSEQWGWPFRLKDCDTGLSGTMMTSWGAVSRIDIHHGGQNWVYVDGHVKWRKVGGKGDTDPWQDPFNYNPDGSIRVDWIDKCGRSWLFRADLEPDDSGIKQPDFT
jgi:hypothetical protein